MENLKLAMLFNTIAVGHASMCITIVNCFLTLVVTAAVFQGTQVSTGLYLWCVLTNADSMFFNLLEHMSSKFKQIHSNHKLVTMI